MVASVQWGEEDRENGNTTTASQGMRSSTRKKSTNPIPRIWQQDKDKTKLSCDESLQCMPIGTSREKNKNNKNYHEGQEARQ